MESLPPSGDRFAEQLRGFGPIGILAILIIILSGNISVGTIIVPFGALFVLLWIRLSQTPWNKIGYIRPKNWTLSLVTGLVIGIAFKFFMKAIVMPLFGADPINHTYHYLAGNRAVLSEAIWAMLGQALGKKLFSGDICLNDSGNFLDLAYGPKY